MKEIILLFHSAKTAYLGKLWFLNYGPKGVRELSKNVYFAFFFSFKNWVIRFGLNWSKMSWNETTIRFLYSTKIACPEKVWFSSYGASMTRPKMCCCFFGKLGHLVWVLLIMKDIDSTLRSNFNILRTVLLFEMLA